MSPSARRKRRAYNAIAERRCKGVRCDELCALLELHGWECINSEGSHFIYAHQAYQGIVNLPKPHYSVEVLRTYCRQALGAIREVEGYE